MARQNYRDLTKEQLVTLLEAKDRKKFGLVWERDAIERERALNDDFVALDAVPELGAGDPLLRIRKMANCTPEPAGISCPQESSAS